MVIFILLVWIVGAAVNSYLYYQRRCGVSVARANGSESNPGMGSAVLLGAVWPLALFSQQFRHPAPCRHSAHAEHWAHVRDLAEGRRKPGGLPDQRAAARSLADRPGHVKAADGTHATAARPPAKQHGAALKAETPDDLTTGQPRTSAIPAESTGYSEGDRVRLAKPFWGEPDPDTGTIMKDWDGPHTGDAPTYPAGSKGTILYPDPAPPEFIREMKAAGHYLLAMDDGRELYAGGPFPGVEGAALERIPGQYQVAHENGKVYLRPKFGDGDRVTLKQSFTSQNTGRCYEAGWEGVICPLAVTMTECWRTGNYPVSLNDDPFGGDRGMINIPAEALELITDNGEDL